MTIAMIPSTGRTYCLISSIKMVLKYKGHEYAPEWLEVVSGEPFGFTYIRDKESFFAVAGYVYHLAGEYLLRTLNYHYTYTGYQNDTDALAALAEVL